MADNIQDPQKLTPASPQMGAGDDESAYARLTPELQKLVDKQVEKRAAILVGYNEVFDRIRGGEQVTTTDFDNVLKDKDIEYPYLPTDAKKELLRATVEALKRDIAEEKAFQVELDKKYPKSDGGEPEPGVLDNVRSALQRTEFVETENGDYTDKLLPLKDRITDAVKVAVIPILEGWQKLDSSRFGVQMDFDSAYEEKSKAWDEANPEITKNMNMAAINKLLLQPLKDKNYPRENTALDASTKDTPALFADLLSKNPGVALTDVHIFDDSFRLVSDNISTFKNSGVDTIYIEAPRKDAEEYLALSSEELRTLVRERKYKDIELSHPDENADAYFANKSDDVDAAYFTMIADAKEKGIRVLAMDIEDENLTFFNDLDPDWRRIGVTNAAWTNAIKQDRAQLEKEGKGGGKFVVIGGADHFTGDGKVDEILGLPVVSLSKGAKDMQPAFEKNTVPSEPDFYVPGGRDYWDTKLQLKKDKFEAIAGGLEKASLSPVAKIAALSAAGVLRSYVNEYDNILKADREKIYTPEELSGQVPVMPPITPNAKPPEESKNR